MAGATLDFNGRVVALGNPLREGETEADAVGLVRSSRIRSIKPIEQVRNHIRRHTHAAVADR